MQRRFISILVVITLCLNLIIVQATSYVQDGSVVQVGPRAKLLDSADENLFKIEGSDQTFVMLDSTSNEGFLVAAYDDYGRHNGVNLVDWINRDFRINGNGEKKLPQSMTANLNYNKQWSDGAKHGMYLVDESIRGVYGDKLGMVDNTGHGRNGVWSFYSAAENSNDTEFYKKTEPEDANGGISVKGGKNIAWDINEIVTVSPGTQNLGKSVIGFTAPKDGIYGLNLTLSGVSGTATDKIRITSCPKDYVYDENLEKTILLSALAGDKIESLNCNLKAGDKIYVHLPNSDNRYNIKYSITQGVNTYDMAKFFDKGENKIWSGDVVNGVRKAYDLNASTAGQILDANENDELLIRPVFCLNSKFFKDNRLDLLNTGKNVLYHLRKNFTIDQLGIYNNYENNSIFHVSEGFLFDEIPLTSNGNPLTTLNGVNHVEGGVNVQNNTADDKTVAYYIALYNENALVDIVSKEAVIPAYNIQTINLDMKIERDVAGLTLKTFIWDGIQTMQPLTEIKATLNKIVRISDASINNTSDFEFYKKAKKEVNVGNYVPLTLNGSSNVTVNSQPTNAWWSKGNVNNEINIRTVADKEVGDGKAGLVIGWTVPYNGNWKISLSIKNVGTDVNGGDGGSVKLTYLPAGRTSDDMPIAVMGVPTSTKNAVYFDSVNTINATGGDKIFFTTDAGVDGYGDQWKVKYQIEETNENGRKILDVGDLNGVAQVDKTGDFKGPSTDGNLVWIGVDGTFGDTVAMQESILYIKKYIPNIGVIFLDGFPERKANMKFYEENGIPTLTQTYGQEYVNFFDATKAWEKEWHGNVLGPGAGYELAGTGHASAMPHPATREAFGRVIKSATEHGFSGFGFPDCVWMWGARGVTGYNEKTLQAFTEDVTKRDRGLRVRLDGVNVTTMNFWDYYSYYAGNDVLNPADIGFASWNDYHPLTVEEWRGMTSAEAIPRLGLFDILCHYEWLKMVQFSADTAQENGGVCQIMPNPEYHPNGVDYLFLNAIENVDMTSEEFFGDTSYLDGAYYRYPYITGFGKGDNVSVGGVMEAGGGGNAGAYYTPEIAYATAYELGASGLEHLETDFWAQSPLDDLKKNENLQRRDTQIMSYGMGFNDSKKDALSKPKGDFVCVSNRRIFRPWSPGNAWEPWTLNLKKAGEVDFVLGKMGYNFDGISQEGLEKMELPQRAVVYSPNKATSRDLEKFCTMVNDGSINNGIISATTLRDRVDSKLNSGAITGDFAYSDNHGVQNVSGNIMAGSTVLKENAKLVGTLYKKKGTDKTVLRHQQASGATRDILVSRQTGKGTMYILLFDPTLTENYQLSEAVYDYLFGTLEIKPRWKSVENTAVLTDGFTQPDTFSETMKNDLCASVRVYENKENLTVVGVQNSAGRFRFDSTVGNMTPYKIQGETKVKVRLESNKKYRYVALPSGSTGTVQADTEGFAQFGFSNTTHEIFYIMPLEAPNLQKLNEIAERSKTWKSALTFDGRVTPLAK